MLVVALAAQAHATNFAVLLDVPGSNDRQDERLYGATDGTLSHWSSDPVTLRHRYESGTGAVLLPPAPLDPTGWTAVFEGDVALSGAGNGGTWNAVVTLTDVAGSPLAGPVQVPVAEGADSASVEVVVLGERVSLTGRLELSGGDTSGLLTLHADTAKPEIALQLEVGQLDLAPVSGPAPLSLPVVAHTSDGFTAPLDLPASLADTDDVVGVVEVLDPDGNVLEAVSGPLVVDAPRVKLGDGLLDLTAGTLAVDVWEREPGAASSVWVEVTPVDPNGPSPVDDPLSTLSASTSSFWSDAVGTPLATSRAQLRNPWMVIHGTDAGGADVDARLLQGLPTVDTGDGIRLGLLDTDPRFDFMTSSLTISGGSIEMYDSAGFPLYAGALVLHRSATRTMSDTTFALSGAPSPGDAYDVRVHVIDDWQGETTWTARVEQFGEILIDGVVWELE
ncbi:MAG: hypothetical protein KC656_14080 [Myxococcales bacterium]|nr:hypothetical protein [Myxococcales bacterium]MCA9568972.1 hypothetical protein [Myxococcales bacterium]